MTMQPRQEGTGQEVGITGIALPVVATDDRSLCELRTLVEDLVLAVGAHLSEHQRIEPAKERLIGGI